MSNGAQETGGEARKTTPVRRVKDPDGQRDKMKVLFWTSCCAVIIADIVLLLGFPNLNWLIPAVLIILFSVGAVIFTMKRF